MGERSAIEWTDHSWSPWWGCQQVGPGCDNCYAMVLDRRFHGPGKAGPRVDWAKGQGPHWGPHAPRMRTKDWAAPERWNRAAERAGEVRTVFPSMCDPFDNAVDPAWRADFGGLIRRTPNLLWLLLTKRSGKVMRQGLVEMFGARSDRTPAVPGEACRPGNVALGRTVVDQGEYDQGWPELRDVFWDCRTAAFTFLSIEPMLGPIDLQVSDDWCDLCGGTGILARWPKGRCYVCDGQGRVRIMGPRSRRGYGRPGWVICGGESGPGARPMHPIWGRGVRDQCASARVPFLFKQWGEFRPCLPVYPAEDPVACAAWLREHHGPDADPADFDFSAADAFDFMKDFPDLGVLYRDGHFYDGLTWQPHVAAGCWWLERVGKKAAGRLLDGREHNDRPAFPAPLVTA